MQSEVGSTDCELDQLVRRATRIGRFGIYLLSIYPAIPYPSAPSYLQPLPFFNPGYYNQISRQHPHFHGQSIRARWQNGKENNPLPISSTSPSALHIWLSYRDDNCCLGSLLISSMGGEGDRGRLRDELFSELLSGDREGV